MSRLEILEEVYGKCEWSESALTNLLRVMELTRQDEQIHQMLVTNPAEVFSRARRNDV